MKIFTRIFYIWVGLVILLGISFLFPHTQASVAGLLNESLDLLLFLICLWLILKEPNGRNKFIFLNFSLFFLFGIVHHLGRFVGPGGLFFSSEPYAYYYYYLYLDRTALYIFLSLAIVYAVVDSLFRDFKIYQKYIIALVIVGGFAASYYHPYFTDPKFLYKTENIRDWIAVEKAWNAYVQEHKQEPTPELLAQQVTLHAWKDGAAVGELYYEEKVKRIAYLSQYIPGDNYLVLLWKPLHLNVIKMNVVCLFFLLLFFGYQYKKDPPQGAYIDKIMFLFLLFCSMEALHAWGYIKAVEWAALAEIFQAGQYVTIGILLLMVVFFSLRLRFITSVKGEFYERELVHNAQHITRWRDWVDNLVIHHFLNPKALRGRLLALWTETGKKELVKTAR